MILTGQGIDFSQRKQLGKLTSCFMDKWLAVLQNEMLKNRASRWAWGSVFAHCW